MLKSTLIETSSFELDFVREAILANNIRLDGRTPKDFRNISIKLSRDELSASSEVSIGETSVISVLSGSIVTPFNDRPNSGFVTINTELSELTESRSVVTRAEISSFLERTIRRSDALDLESLCILSGEKVWKLHCEVRVVDCSGGNLFDTAMLSMIAALKAFRLPDISIISEKSMSKSSNNTNNTKVIIHHSDDREPQALSVQHTPLTMTLAIFKKNKKIQGFAANNPDAKSGANNNSSSANGNVEDVAASSTLSKYVTVIDPSRIEEVACDGRVIFSINTFKELCAISKPGGTALPVEVIVEAAQVCAKYIDLLHRKLQDALQELEQQMIKQRELRLIKLRQYQVKIQVALQLQQQQADQGDGDEDDTEMMESNDVGYSHGIDRNDPILQWHNLHAPAPIREE